MIASHKKEKRIRRKNSIRLRVVGSGERPRLSVFRSLKHIYAQVIDDTRGVTLASVGNLKSERDEKGKTAAAKRVGEEVAKACLAQGIERVVFDRNGFVYHGRIAAVAQGARDAGLKF